MKHLTRKNIYNFLKFHKIKKNDIVFIHGNASVIKQVQGKNNQQKIDTFWNYFFDYFIHSGTIIVPTFTYSLTKKKSSILILPKVLLVFFLKLLEI